MTLALDLITNRNLLLVKQIYQRAATQAAARHSEVDMILSLISFDLANETLLKNALLAADGRANVPSDLAKLIEAADEAFARASPALPAVPDAAKVRRVRRVRNSAMHEAKYPTVADLHDCRTYTRDFLQQLVLNVWGKDFGSMRLTDLIRDAEVRTYLVKAEEKLRAGDHTGAAIQAKAGFGRALAAVKSSIVGRMPGYADRLVVADGHDMKPSREAFDALERTRDAVTLSVTGLDQAGYHRYSRLTRHLHVAYFGQGKIEAAISGPQLSADEAEYVVNYAVGAVVQIEALAGDIERPFGGDET